MKHNILATSLPLVASAGCQNVESTSSVNAFFILYVTVIFNWMTKNYHWAAKFLLSEPKAVPKTNKKT